MDALAAASPSLLVAQGPVTGPTTGDQKPAAAPDVADRAAVAVHMRKVDPFEGGTSVLSAQEFARLLDKLVPVLDEVVFTGTIENYLKCADGAENLLSILPESFTSRLQNDMFELLSLMPHGPLGKLLCDAVSALKHGADRQQSKSTLTQYMTLMERVFIQRIFTPDEHFSIFDNQNYLQNGMFEALLDLRLTIWERDHSDINELGVLGVEPWESSQVLSALARYHGHTFQHGARGEKPTGDLGCQPIRGCYLDPFCSPWRRYHNHGKPVELMLPGSSWLPENFATEIDKLNALDSGFYTLASTRYLYVGDASSEAKFSVFLFTGLQFDFRDSSSLYEFIDQNHCLRVELQRLEYSPRYFSFSTKGCSLPDDVVEALQTLGINEESLSSLTRDQLKGRFRRLARQYHPDKTHSDCTEAFLRLSQAQETLEQWLVGQWVDSDAQGSE